MNTPKDVNERTTAGPQHKTHLGVVRLDLMFKVILGGCHWVGGSLEHGTGGHWGGQGGSRVGGGSLVDGCDPLLHVHGVTMEEWGGGGEG